MSCQRCGSARIAEIMAHCQDCSNIRVSSDKFEHNGYFPGIPGFGGGDDVEFVVCFDCGQVQGTFPICLIEIKAVLEAEAAEKLERLAEYRAKLDKSLEDHLYNRY